MFALLVRLNCQLRSQLQQLHDVQLQQLLVDTLCTAQWHVAKVVQGLRAL